jgi:two-component system, NarL family, response regulator LiaR
MIRILVCDDQVVVCEGLRAILGTVAGLEVVGVAHDGAEALGLIAALHPNIVLMDLKMPVMNGIQATREIRTRFPEVRVLVLTTYDLDEWIFDAVRSGAAGYLLKDTPRDMLVAAIQGTAAGKTYVDPVVAGRLLAAVRHEATAPDAELVRLLSERELEVLRLVAHGLNNAEIAAKLFLSEGTVRNYVSAILAKLGAADRTQAAILALRAGLGEGL